MPNNITNEVKFDCTEKKFEEIAEFLRIDESYLGTVDFNKLIPMPKELDIISGSLGLAGYKLYKEFLEATEGMTDEEKISKIYNAFTERSDDAKEAMELGKKYYDNIENYGAPTWYEWCCDNWGTKWNAYECEEAHDNTLRFFTAWSAVPAIIKALSIKYPEVDITYKWADEDIGCNVGIINCKGGKINNIDIPSQCSKEAYEMSAEIIGFDLKDSGFKLTEDGKTYEWSDDNMNYEWDENED